MAEQQHDPLSDFDRREITIDGLSREVFVQGSGPAILVLPEIPGITPDVADCARRLTEAGFTTWVPSLFGTPGRPFTRGLALRTFAKECVNKQFRAFARAERVPAIDWLRELGRQAHDECGGPGIGVIGMCFTGNFALALAIDERVKVPVMSQPSMPVGFRSASKEAIHMDPKDLLTVKQRTTDEENLCVIGLRFTGDPLVPAERFATLRREFGDAFIGVEIDSSKDNEWGYPRDAHSVTTKEWSADPENPTAQAWAMIVDHFTTKLLG